MSKKGKTQSSQQRAAPVSRGVWIVLAIATVAIAALFYLSKRQSMNSSASVSAAPAAATQMPAIPAPNQAKVSETGAQSGSFGPTLANRNPAPEAQPDGMAWIPGENSRWAPTILQRWMKWE